MIAPLMASAGPQPDANESYEHFIIRAHQQLQQSQPDPMTRNDLIWQAWEQANGPTPEQQIAGRSFPIDRYTPLRNQCIFAEHEALDGQGQPRKYGLPEMVRVLRGCNHRIRDIDGFAPLTDGHTPSGDKGGKSPTIVGYAGPYRLGMIGRENPRWAVFCDEWHQNEVAGAVATKPRRSVELWTFKDDPTKLYFDPIAILGAETPRLPLPVRYQSLEVAGAQVERYSFEGGATPGGANTFVRGPVRQGPAKRKGRVLPVDYSSLDTRPPQAGSVEYEFDEAKIKRDNVGQFATKAGTGLKTQRPDTTGEQLKKTPMGPGRVVDLKKPPPRFASRGEGFGPPELKLPKGAPTSRPTAPAPFKPPKGTSTGPTSGTSDPEWTAEHERNWQASHHWAKRFAVGYASHVLASMAVGSMSTPATAGLALGAMLMRHRLSKRIEKRASQGKSTGAAELGRAALTGASIGVGTAAAGKAAIGALGRVSRTVPDAHVAASSWPPKGMATGAQESVKRAVRDHEDILGGSRLRDILSKRRAVSDSTALSPYSATAYGCKPVKYDTRQELNPEISWA